MIIKHEPRTGVGEHVLEPGVTEVRHPLFMDVAIELPPSPSEQRHRALGIAIRDLNVTAAEFVLKAYHPDLPARDPTGQTKDELLAMANVYADAITILRVELQK